MASELQHDPFKDVIWQVKREVPDMEARKRIYRCLIDAFLDRGWDSTYDDLFCIDDAWDSVRDPEVYGNN